jgi:hypothetical protein
MPKNGTFSDILQKVKTYCFAKTVAIIRRLDPIEIFFKYKIEAPFMYVDVMPTCSV